MIILMGYVHLDPSDVSEFAADVEAVAGSTKAERGCLFYSVALEDALAGRMQIGAEKGTFLLCPDPLT